MVVAIMLVQAHRNLAQSNYRKKGNSWYNKIFYIFAERTNQLHKMIVKKLRALKGEVEANYHASRDDNPSFVFQGFVI
jgi:hypothetical protein